LESKDEAVQVSKKPRVQTIILLVLVVVSVVLTGWALVVVSTGSQIPSSDFVTLPTTHLSTQGDKVIFVSISGITQKSLTVGVQGYLKTASGTAVAGAKVYLTYYLQGVYRTQVATTDQNGHFVAQFPMNWTGSLHTTLTYFGDSQHQGLSQLFSVVGEAQ
jgi:hypothetical protein